jgi:NAD(P)-dependent dehydrogenase (short-subunit alcohol dehydrogenase family)
MPSGFDSRIAEGSLSELIDNIIVSAVKAALVHLTKCLAVKWGKYNITVNAVADFYRNAWY